MLIIQISSLANLFEKLLNFVSVIEKHTQSCLLYSSLVSGPQLKFFHETTKKAEDYYDEGFFQSVQFATAFMTRFLKVFLPMSIVLFVFFRIERAEFRKYHEIHHGQNTHATQSRSKY